MLLLYTYVQTDSALMHKQNLYRSAQTRAISAFMERVYPVYVGPLIAARAVNVVDWPNMR